MVHIQMHLVGELSFSIQEYCTILNTNDNTGHSISNSLSQSLGEALNVSPLSMTFVIDFLYIQLIILRNFSFIALKNVNSNLFWYNLLIAKYINPKCTTQWSLTNHCQNVIMIQINIFLGKYLGVEWLGRMVDICLIFRESAKVFSKGVVPFYVPTSNKWRPQFHQLLSNTFQFFKSYPSDCIVSLWVCVVFP